MQNLIKLIFLMLLIPYYEVDAQRHYDLIVKVGNIKKMKGSMMLAIYDHKDRFLLDDLVGMKKVIDDDEMVFVFNELEEGRYAISVFQDENNNEELDKNFMGIPIEPYAFSNNARGMFGPPDFEECAFDFYTDLNISINL